MCEHFSKKKKFTFSPLAFGTYHPIVNINNAESDDQEKVVICGNSADASDILTFEHNQVQERELSDPKEGDNLAIQIVGSYGYALASNYSARPRPAAILVSGSKSVIIRRAEKVKDLVDQQTL